MDDLFIHTCAIAEYQETDVPDHMVMVEVATDVPCLILPMSATAALQNRYSPGRAYDAYFDAYADVKVGQRIRWNGREMYIGGIAPFEDDPDVAHKRFACTEDID